MIRFWYGSGSPYSWRVQLLLEEKGLPYEPVLLSFQKGDHKAAEHLARHPHGKVPALADGDVALYESTAIVEYLEERYQEPLFLPRDPTRRGHVRIEEIEATEYFGGKFRDLARQVFFTPAAERNPGAIACAQAGVRHEIERLEARASRRRGAWIMSDDGPTRADVTWIPFIEIAARAGVDLDSQHTPWLHAWRDRMRARPSYRASYPPHWRQA